MKPTGPIPSFGKKTVYRGVEFKSKCEARWAALFDLLGLEWDYEPNGSDTFPDFLVKDGDELLIEVKGALHGAPTYMDLHREWVAHPDAIKARRSAAGYGAGPVCIACSDGYLFESKANADLTQTLSWQAVQFSSQSEYHWPRTLAMISGKVDE